MTQVNSVRSRLSDKTQFLSFIWRHRSDGGGGGGGKKKKHNQSKFSNKILIFDSACY
jgi:hypothetical protein